MELRFRACHREGALKPEILGLVGIDFDIAVDGVVVEHVGLRPAGRRWGVRAAVSRAGQRVMTPAVPFPSF